jgi:hypothetical protein
MLRCASVAYKCDRVGRGNAPELLRCLLQLAAKLLLKQLEKRLLFFGEVTLLGDEDLL